MEVRYLRIKVLHICKRKSGSPYCFWCGGPDFISFFSEHFAGYYLPDSYNILKEKRCTGDSRVSIIHKMGSEKTGSILQLFTGEKKKVWYNKKNTVKKEMQ